MSTWTRQYKLLTLGCRAGPKHMKYHMLCHLVTIILFLYFWIRFNGGLIPSFLTTQPEQKPLGVHILDFFPQLQQDASKITWACAVNKEEDVKKALNGDMHVLEGDVVLRGQGTADQQMEPIMASLPSVTGDLTFTQWIALTKDSGKAIKLDFQSIEAIELTLQILNKLETKLKAPLWLSGEVLKGPNSETEPLDNQRFLRLCTQDYPHSTLLLGWRTGPIKTDTRNGYSWQMVKEMHDLVEKWTIKQILVFSVKAAYARSSMSQLKWLVEMTGGSLAIFSDPNDGMTVDDLLHIHHKLPASKVYYDLADDLQNQFDSIKTDPSRWGPTGHSPAPHEMFRTEEWNVMRTGKKEQVYVGTEAVLLQGGLITSKATFLATQTVQVNVTGRIEFLPGEESDTEGDNTVQPLGVDIFLRVTQGARPSAISGIKCFIGAQGKLSISAQSVPGSDSHAETLWQDMPPCVDFSILDSGSDKVMLTVSQPADCYAPTYKVIQKKSVVMRTDTISIDGGQVAIRGSDNSGFVAIPMLSVSTFR